MPARELPDGTGDEKNARCKPQFDNDLRFRFGFTKTSDTVAVFALTAFFEKFGALKTFENVPFPTQGRSCAQAAML